MMTIYMINILGMYEPIHIETLGQEIKPQRIVRSVKPRKPQTKVSFNRTQNK
jgi:hypothetical protein